MANGDASSAVVQAEQVVVDVVGCAHLDQLEGLASKFNINFDILK